MVQRHSFIMARHILVVVVLLLLSTAFTQQVLIPAHGQYTYTAPTISPDGKYLAFLRMQENEMWTRPATAVCFVRIKDLGGPFPFNGATEELYGSSTLEPQRIVGWLRNADGKVGLSYFVHGKSEISGRLLVQQIADGEPSRFKMPDYNYFRNILFSPSTQKIVAIVPLPNRKERLLLMLQEGKQITIADGGSFDGITWTQDESIIIFSASGLRKDGQSVNGTYQLFRYEVASDKLTKFTPDGKSNDQMPQLMPDKQHLLFLSGDNQLDTLGMGARNGLNKWMSKYNVCITPLNTYVPRIITTGMCPIISPDGKKLFMYQYRDADPKEHHYGKCMGIITDLTGKELKTIDFGDETQYTGEGFAFAGDNTHFIYARKGSLWLDTIADNVVE